MLFPSITLAGRPAILLLAAPDWAVRPKLSRVFGTSESEGRTGIEARASDWHVGRLALEYRYTLSAAAAEEFHAALLALGTQLLALPLEPDRLPAADYTDANRYFLAPHWLNWNSATGAYSIDAAGGHPESSGLVLCSIAERPRLQAISDLDAAVVLRVEEDAPWEARLSINTLAMPAWDLEPDWAQAVEETSKWQLKRSRLGRGRESVVQGDDAPAKRGQRAGFTLPDRATIRRVLTFWEAARGAHNAFTVPRFFRPGWDGVPGNEPVMQARFGQSALVLEFANQDAARCTLTFWQELLLQPGEPVQPRPSRAHAYKVWWDGSATLMTWTDWESPLTIAGLTYQPQKIEHKAPVENLRPGTSEWEIALRDFAGNPLRAFALLALERRLRLEIRECDPTAADATARLRLAGEVVRVAVRDKVFTAQVSAFGGRLKKLIPGCLVQQACNNTLYDTLCTLDPALWQVLGAVTAIAGAVVDINAGSDRPVEWFAEGYAEFGAGDAAEVRYIVRSAPIVGVGTRITLHRPLLTSVVGAAAKLLPGCDSQFTGGCLKFNNQVNFFGAPYKPAYIETVDSGFKAKIGK